MWTIISFFLVIGSIKCALQGDPLAISIWIALASVMYVIGWGIEEESKRVEKLGWNATETQKAAARKSTQKEILVYIGTGIFVMLDVCIYAYLQAGGFR